ncbi:MAG: hypothetical protein WBJ81_06060 [Rickettsiales bacterium]
MKASCGCNRSNMAGKLAKEAVTHATGNEAAGSIVEGIVSAATCKTNAKIMVPTALGAVNEVATISYSYIYAFLVGGVAAVASFFNFYKVKKSLLEECPIDWAYKPVALSKKDFLNKTSATKIESSAKMKGTVGSDFMAASSEGSKIFAINGADYLVSGPGKDQFYFSLCNTEEIDIIKKFDPKMDKIFFFCTQNKIIQENISICHQQQDDIDLTFIKVQGNEKTSVIALLGNIEITTDDIVLNQSWEN